MKEKFVLLRKELNLSQKQMADYLDVDQSYVSKLENGEREITVSILQKVANLAGVDLGYFFNKSDERLGTISFRTSNLNSEDLKEIAKINQIALNLKWMYSKAEAKNEK